jgi:outer membrane protein assembly factor BamB
MTATRLGAALLGAATILGGSAVPAAADWTTYHYDNSHNGYDASAPAFGAVTPNWTTAGGAIDGDILAEPLYSAGVVYVVTMHNFIYALDPTDGHTLWSKRFELPCPASCIPPGDSIPSDAVGIMSTPVIDPVANVLYAVGMNSSGLYHMWAVDLSGSTHGLVYLAVSVDPPRDPGQHSTQAAPNGQNGAQNQRGALTLSSAGRLYIPYGGRAGDCCGYHGYVVSVIAADGTGFVSYHTPLDPAGEAGMWSSGGVAIDAGGNVFASTGNGLATSPTSTYDYGNSVLKLSPTLTLLDSWAPSDWASLAASDTDVGSTGPTLIGTSRVFLSGKNGVGYLLNQTTLGGIGGEIYQASVCSAESMGGHAYAGGYVYMPCENGLYALRLVGSPATAFTTAWSLPNITAGPPIVTGGAVWVIDTSGPTLYALNPTTGTVMGSQAIAGGVEHFVTPSEGGGNIYVPGSGFVQAFSIATWSASYDMTGAPTTWVAGEAQTFPVTVTNTGTTTWPSTGYRKVDLDLHFTTQSGGSSKIASWLNSSAFPLPADLAPSASVTLTVSFAAPSRTGPLVLEAEMIKEHTFWFQQWQPVSVMVAAAVWTAAYNLAGVPYSWTHGRSQNVTVILYNLGNITWPRSGTYRVDLNIHFTTVPGGSTKIANWVTSQTFALAHSLPPGANVTMTFSVLAPSGRGRMYLEAEMKKEHQFWFKKAAATRVIVR